MNTSITLDDTFLAVVQVTHDAGLPLRRATVARGDVMVHTDPADMRWWVRWLTDPASSGVRSVVWRDDGKDYAAFHVAGTREGITWTVVEQVPVEVAEQVLAAHGVTLTADHQPVSREVAVVVADALADHVHCPRETAGCGEVSR